MNVFDYYFVECFNFSLRSVRSVGPTENLNSLDERKISNVQTRKTQLIFLPKESFSVSCSSLRYRGAKLITFLTKTGLGTVDFSERIKRKTLNKMQSAVIKDQIANLIFH